MTNDGKFCCPSIGASHISKKTDAHTRKKLFPVEGSGKMPNNAPTVVNFWENLNNDILLIFHLKRDDIISVARKIHFLYEKNRIENY